MFYVNWGRLLVHKRESYFMLSSWGWHLVSNILAPGCQVPGSAGEQLDQDVNSVHRAAGSWPAQLSVSWGVWGQQQKGADISWQQCGGSSHTDTIVMDDPVYRVVEIPGAGRGLVATRDIAKGELVLNAGAAVTGPCARWLFNTSLL